MKEPKEVPLFGAEGLRQFERVNDEIARNGRAGQKNQPVRPLFDDHDQDADAWIISYGGVRVGTARL